MARALQVVVMMGVLCCALVFSGCGRKTEEPVTQTTLTIGADGRVQYEIVESFDQSYYDVEELARLSEEAVAAYNMKNDGERVQLVRTEITDGMLHMVLDFASASDFSHFGFVSLTYDTVDGVRQNGQTVPSGLIDAKGETVSTAELMVEEANRHIIISQEPAQLRTPYKIRYHSADTELTSSHIATPAEDTTLPIVLILDK